MRRFIKTFKNSLLGKTLKTIFKILLWGLEILIIFLAIIIVTQRVTKDQETFLGFRIYNVATGSMEPEYAVGDILISKERAPSEIEVGDNIVYLGKEGGYSGKIITHSVIGIEQNEKGEYLFHTKGRANTLEDPIVHEEQLYGVIVQNNIVLAWLCKILTNRYGLYFFVVIPIIIYAFVGFVKAQSQKIEQEKQEEFERKKRKEAMRKKRNHTQVPRRRVIEIEDDEEFEEEFEEEEYEEVVIEEKPKVQKKPKTNSTSKKKNIEEEPKILEKPKTSKKSNSKSTVNPKTQEKPVKKTTKSNKTASAEEKVPSKKKAKEE